MLQNGNQDIIKIGALLPFTGKDCIYGQWIKEALELGKEEINSNGGIKGKSLEIIYEDDAANPKKAVSGMKRLLKKINVPIIYGSWASSCVSAQIPIARKTKTIIVAEAIAPQMKNTGGYLFRIQPESEYYLKKLVPFAYFDLKIKKAGIFYAKNDFGEKQAAVFKELFENLGGEILRVDNFLQGNKNFKTKLVEFKKLNIEALFIPAYTEIADILREIRELNIKTRILASVPFENPDIIAHAKAAAEKVIYPYHYAPDPENKIDLEFRRNYRRKYKKEPEGFASLAYEGIKVIEQALKNWDWKNSESLKEEFFKVHYLGIAGEIIFDGTGNSIKKIIIKTVKNGKFVRVKESADKLYLRKVGPQLSEKHYL